MKGYAGQILFIDLSDGSLKRKKLPEKVYRDFVGGYGITAKILHEDFKPKADPLGPENILGFMTGPLNGLPISMAARAVFAAKSPLTGTIGESNIGGYIGAELKKPVMMVSFLRELHQSRSICGFPMDSFR